MNQKISQKEALKMPSIHMGADTTVVDGVDIMVGTQGVATMVDTQGVDTTVVVIQDIVAGHMDAN